MYAVRMHELGKYHAHGIRTLDNGFCSFHAQNICSCGNCGDEELKCKGKPYKSKNIVTCPLHALAYAAQVIHSELGRGIPISANQHSVSLNEISSQKSSIASPHQHVHNKLGACDELPVFLAGEKGS